MDKGEIEKIIELRERFTEEAHYAFNLGIVLQDHPELWDSIFNFLDLCEKNRNKRPRVQDNFATGLEHGKAIGYKRGYSHGHEDGYQEGLNA